MPPANQRLGTDQRAGTTIDLWLIEKNQFVALQRPSEAALELETFAADTCLFGRVEPESVAATAFGASKSLAANRFFLRLTVAGTNAMLVPAAPMD